MLHVDHELACCRLLVLCTLVLVKKKMLHVAVCRAFEFKFISAPPAPTREHIAIAQRVGWTAAQK